MVCSLAAPSTFCRVQLSRFCPKIVSASMRIHPHSFHQNSVLGITAWNGKGGYGNCLQVVDECRSALRNFFGKDIEGCSADIKTATLDALVEAVVNQKSNYAKVETSITVNIHKEHPVIEDEITKLKQKFAFDDFIISDDMSRHVIEEYKKWVEEGLLKFHAKKIDQEYRFTTTNCFFKSYIEKTYRRYDPDDSDTVLSTQQDYVQSVIVVQNEEALTNIIKEFCIPARLPWHLVAEVYVLVNCNEKFY
ncbi:hypothetical protein FXO38_07187 [Capsicum annuum]|nr:hypothetical protein FXO38_07187 [Capsicum annuum]